MVGAVTSDHTDLTTAIAQAAEDIPVFGLVNELHATALSGRIGVDWQDMWYAVGKYLAERHNTGSPPKTAVIISGPTEAGWTGPLDQGLRDGLTESSVDVIDVFGADTGLRQQLALVETALALYPDIDYLIGRAAAAEAAIGLFANSRAPMQPQLISTYISQTVLRGLMNSSVLAVPFDDPELQGVMALNQAVSVLASGRPAGLVGPKITLLTASDNDLVDIRISPSEYFQSIH